MAEDLIAQRREFLEALVSARHLIPSGVPGVYGRSGVFEDIVDRVGNLVTELGKDDGAEVMRFPPVISRATFVQSEYLKGFPDMAGTINAFRGKDKEHHELLAELEAGRDWTKDFLPTDVVLAPAACYPAYPTATGTLPEGGKVIDVLTYCFRHEPSDDPARMQSFRQREHIRIGKPEDVRKWRGLWLERGQTLVSWLALPGTPDVANDPFFGRGGRMLKLDQRDQQLKFEMLVPITSVEAPTACISFNYHQEHFGRAFKIQTDDGEVAHTACVGFGMERITLAMFKTHGLDPKTWPAAVRAKLWP
jgi:seryl-tRNA synthetase